MTDGQIARRAASRTRVAPRVAVRAVAAKQLPPTSQGAGATGSASV